MEMKSFFGPSVAAALAKAEAEWGSNAFVVTSRAAAPDSLHLGAQEVVCGRGEAASGQETPAHLSRPVPAGDVDDLRAQIESIRRTLSRLALPAPAWLPRSSELAEYLNELIAADVEEQLAHDIVESAYRRLGDVKTDVASVLQSELRRLVPDWSAAGSRVSCFVGPTGVGKTTTLVKIAARAVQQRRSVQVLTLDTWRVAAVEQLRSFCAILGVGFQVVESAALLQHAVDGHAGKDSVLIDTPGISPADEAILEEIQSALGTTPEVERHLVLRANLSGRDFRKAFSRFSRFQPDCLVFTHLDEAVTLGPAYTLAATSRVPVSWLCNGQQVPEDIVDTTEAGLASFVLPRPLEHATRSAA